MNALLKSVLMMDRWTDICRKKKYIPEVVKSNIEYDDYALWAEDFDGYMTVEGLDETVQMIVRASCRENGFGYSRPYMLCFGMFSCGYNQIREQMKRFNLMG